LDQGLDATALGELAAADVVHVVNGVAAVAYPFSGIPTPHRVELDDLLAVYAMCAVDGSACPSWPAGTARSVPPTRTTASPSS
jgi:hypothetical protein